jgi:hypothetical protein
MGATVYDLVWKNASGQCWRAGYWTPSMADRECDPDLMPRVARRRRPRRRQQP